MSLTAWLVAAMAVLPAFALAVCLLVATAQADAELGRCASEAGDDGLHFD